MMAAAPDPELRRVHRFGVVVDEFSGLAGARDFIVGVVDGLARAAGDRKVVLIVRRPNLGHGPRGIARKLKRVARASLGRPAPEMLNLAPLKDCGLPDIPILSVEWSERALLSLCQRECIDVLGPLGDMPPSASNIPWVGYIYDFQHRHLSRLFPEAVIAERDAKFGRVLSFAGAVVVNAEAVKIDANFFFPGLADRVVSLPFSAAPQGDWFSQDPVVARRKYQVGERYFLISNHFWLHKQHEVALHAFSAVMRECANVELVLTGQTDDWRAPTRLADIKNISNRLGIETKVHILGHIPKLDQIALMRGAVAVVQPTAFEGGPGGGSVFDAVALGVPTIVSDIPVNREISDEITRFFPLGMSEAAARAMLDILSAKRVTPSPSELMAKGERRRLAMGHEIWRAAEIAARHTHRVRREHG